MQDLEDQIPGLVSRTVRDQRGAVPIPREGQWFRSAIVHPARTPHEAVPIPRASSAATMKDLEDQIPGLVARTSRTSTPSLPQQGPKLRQQRFERSNRSEEIRHVVRSKVLMRPKIARLGVVSTTISSWLFIPSSMTGCAMDWCMLSQVPTPELSSLCSLLATEVQVPIEFEHHKGQWLDQLKANPVDIVVVDGNVRLPAASQWFWSPESPVNCVISRHPL